MAQNFTSQLNKNAVVLSTLKRERDFANVSDRRTFLTVSEVLKTVKNDLRF